MKMLIVCWARVIVATETKERAYAVRAASKSAVVVRVWCVSKRPLHMC
jgi:hypothetical protein